MRLAFDGGFRTRRRRRDSRFDCSGDTADCVQVLVREGGVWVGRAQVDAIRRTAPIATRIAGGDSSGHIFIAAAR